MIGILVFANWAKPDSSDAGAVATIYRLKWVFTAVFAIALVLM